MINSREQDFRTSPVAFLGGSPELLQIYLTSSRRERAERFIDSSTAAELTGLSRRTIQWWVEGGLVDAVLIGRRYQIDRRSLLAYLAARASSPIS